MGKKKNEKDPGQMIKEFMDRLVNGETVQAQMPPSASSLNPASTETPAITPTTSFSRYGGEEKGGLRKFIFVDPTGPTEPRPARKETSEEIPDVPQNANSHQKDSHDEAVQSAFLVRNFYPKLGADMGYSFRATRKTMDKGLQISGIDAYGTKEKPNGALEFLYIDEKCAFTRPNNLLKTFSFEIYFKDQHTHDWANGWFVKTEISTDYYLLLYPFFPFDKLKKGTLKDKDILALEGIFIKRAAIVGYVKECGFEMQDLLDVQEAMRNSDKQTLAELKNGMRIQISYDYPEQPANLLIPKKSLIGLCDNRYAIEPTGSYLLDKSGVYTPSAQQKSEE